ncbi:hypothetical protein TNCV_4085221 [Trichonephila clavipes]|nr:hypothetical protein TNCV_4085221 [Trichonephila clavipes]
MRCGEEREGDPPLEFKIVDSGIEEIKDSLFTFLDLAGLKNCGGKRPQTQGILYRLAGLDGQKIYRLFCPFQGYTDRADSSYLYPSGNNVNDSEMANLPTDMELELAPSQRNSTRTLSPQPQLTPCEQLKYNKAQLEKMETFRSCKQAFFDALLMISDHYLEEPFYVRALKELQDVEETMALAVRDIDSFEPCNIPVCPHHEKNPQNSPLKMTQSTPKINPHDNNSGKRKDNSNFEYSPLI